MTRKSFMCIVIAIGIASAFGTARSEEERTPFPDRIREGEWAIHALGGNPELTMKLTVVSIAGTGDDAVVTTKCEIFAKGNLAESSTTQQTMGALREDDRKTAGKISRKEKIMVKGREIETEVSVERNGDMEEIMYGCDDIPVTGVVKWTKGKIGGDPFTMSELIDYGGR